jgi:hypothetical protein
MKKMCWSVLSLALACGEAPPQQKWQSAPGWQLEQLAGASEGGEAALAYVEVMPERWRVMLQALDSAGARRGAAIELAAVTSPSPPARLTLATDGNRTIACWAFEGEVACAAPQRGVVLRVPGAAPALAHRKGVWALAYGDLSGNLMMLRLDQEGGAIGPAQILVTGSDRATPLLAATKSGFVLVGGQSMSVRRLDGALQPIGPPLDLGLPFWFFGSVAATDTRIAVNLAIPYASRLFVIEGDKVLHTFPIEGRYKTGRDVALASDGTSIGAAWWDDRGALADSAVETALAPVPILPGAQGSQALLVVARHLLLATTDRQPSGTEILLAPLP